MKVELEYYLPELQGLVDVAVLGDNEERVTAIEIALSNKYEHEADNIEKCLRAGFQKVISTAPSEFILKGIKKECLNRNIDLEKVEFKLLQEYYNLTHRKSRSK